METKTDFIAKAEFAMKTIVFIVIMIIGVLMINKLLEDPSTKVNQEHEDARIESEIAKMKLAKASDELQAEELRIKKEQATGLAKKQLATLTAIEETKKSQAELKKQESEHSKTLLEQLTKLTSKNS